MKMRLKPHQEKALRDIVALKKCCPHFFEEWHRVQTAERRLQAAKDELITAKAVWKSIGRKK